MIGGSRLYFGRRAESSPRTRTRRWRTRERAPGHAPVRSAESMTACPHRDRRRPARLGRGRLLRPPARPLGSERRVHGGRARGHGRDAGVRRCMVPRPRDVGRPRGTKCARDHGRSARRALRDRVGGLPCRGVGLRDPDAPDIGPDGRPGFGSCGRSVGAPRVHSGGASPPSSRGLGRHPFKVEIRGSNPLGGKPAVFPGRRVGPVASSRWTPRRGPARRPAR